MDRNKEVMLTTYDNPFDPFQDFYSWWKNDLRLGHDSCGTLARRSATSEILSDDLNEKSILSAMEEICEEEPTVFRMVTPDDFKNGVVIRKNKVPEGGM